MYVLQSIQCCSWQRGHSAILSPFSHETDSLRTIICFAAALSLCFYVLHSCVPTAFSLITNSTTFRRPTNEKLNENTHEIETIVVLIAFIPHQIRSKFSIRHQFGNRIDSRRKGDSTENDKLHDIKAIRWASMKHRAPSVYKSIATPFHTHFHQMALDAQKQQMGSNTVQNSSCNTLNAMLSILHISWMCDRSIADLSFSKFTQFQFDPANFQCATLIWLHLSRILNCYAQQRRQQVSRCSLRCHFKCHFAEFGRSIWHWVDWRQSAAYRATVLTLFIYYFFYKWNLRPIY